MNSVQELVGGTPTANLLTGGVDENFLRADAAGFWTFLPDALGSTLALTDGSGTPATQYSYEPFGATTITGAGSNNPAQLTGRENDGTGLYYYRARYYSPVAQRFVSEDPIGFSGGSVNLHIYVGNRPTASGDPSGRIAPLVGACIIGAAFDVGWTLGSRKDAGFGDAATAAARGCLSGLTGFGLGKALGWAADALSARALEAAVDDATTAFTKHGMERLIERGISLEDILDALRNPIEVEEGVDALGRSWTQYVGPNATVVVNDAGKIITLWGSGPGLL